MEILRKNKQYLIVVVYLFFYSLAFLALERNISNYHIIHVTLDDMIPFCEYFIVPYLLWFPYVLLTIIYLGREDLKEYKKFIYSLGIVSTLFLIISMLFPNGHDLRPIITGDNIFIRMVEALHVVDTPTNILPSLHVYVSVVCATTLSRNPKIRDKKMVYIFSNVLAILIVLSTMFLKQHSVVDVGLALVFNYLIYELMYNLYSRYENKLTVNRKVLFNPSNVLSTMRVCLSIILLGAYRNSWINLINGIICTLIITDFLDNKMIRSTNILTFILNRVADVLSQLSLLIVIAPNYSFFRIVIWLFIMKEIVYGYSLLSGAYLKSDYYFSNSQAKVCSVVLYSIACVVMFVDSMNLSLYYILFMIYGIFVVNACFNGLNQQEMLLEW